MNNLKRISLEVVIIFLLLFIANYSFGQFTKYPEAWAKERLIGFKVASKIIPFEVSGKKLFNTYEEAGYYENAPFFPALAYDPMGKQLVPLNLRSPYLTSSRPLSGHQTAVILAGYRDAVASSNKDLEERVRKLENTVSRIISKCCPKAKAG